jgi:hypothetical protein
MMKTTQFLTNIKLWQGIFFSFLLLVSLNLNSQNVGDDLLANSNGMVDTTSGATGSGGGCFSTGNNGSPGGTYDGSTECGWTSAAGLNYAPSTGGHGPTHSGDRMFKSYKTNGSAGEFIAQEVGELALGTYTYSFFHRWTGGSIDYTEGAPKFTIKEQNADGGWDNVLVVDLAEGNTGASGEWTETTGTWVNENVNNYKIQVYKNGAANAGLAQNLHLDSFSFVYTEAASTSSGCDLTINMVDSYGDGWNGGELVVSVNGTVVGTYANTSDAGANEAQTVSLSTSYGDDVTFDFTCGSYCGETSFTVTDADGNTVASGGGSNSGDATYSCVDPNAVGLAVTATTDGGSATFSFDLANFTVGAAGDTGVDGHIHYSLNGGAEVMVYSSDDLTLSELPNGDHTIVFSLVDDAHQALDPAVEVTVAFSTNNGNYEGDFPFCSSFDASLGQWTTELVSGDATWSSSASNQNGSVTPLTGAGMAYIYDNNSVSNLISPVMDLSAMDTPQISFSYTQVNWAGDQDELRVWARASATGEWTQIGEFTAEAAAWTAVTIDLPNASATYQVAFNGTAAYGRGITIDDACVSDAGPSTSAVTFNVNMTQYGLMDGDTVHVNGEFTGWCGSCGNEMTDPDGDGIYSITMDLEDGSYFWKFTVNAWNDQEGFSEAIAGCTADNNGNFDRQIVVDGADQSVSYCWNSCSDTGCEALSLQGIIDFTVPSGGSDGKAIHVYAHADIADLSTFGIGVANNGGGTDGQEYTFDAISVSAGDHILVARTPAVMDEYMDASTIFNHVLLASSDISQNGDDAIELYLNGAVVELFGDVDVDGTGEAWEYMDSWAYKVEGAWTYGGVDCTDGSTTTCDSSCPYPFAFCDTSGAVVDFLMSGTWRVQAEASGHIGVGSGGAYYAEWWNANPWEKWETGLYDDGWTFTDTAMTHDTGDDGAIFGKKDAIDLNFDPDGTVAYPADNGDNEYLYYALEDYSDNYTVNTGGNYDTVTFETVGNLGFYTSAGAQEFQILETGEGYVYLRNVGSDGNSWYNMMTTADYLSTSDNEILDMMVYPNPVDGNYVTIISPVEGLKEIQVFTVTGRKVMDTVINGNTLDVSSFNSGFYMLKVTINGQSKISKLVVR